MPKSFDHDKATDEELAEHQRALQFDTDTTPLDESETPERFVVNDELQAESGKGLPKGVGLERSITDPNLVSETAGDRQWVRTYTTDEDGVEKPGSEKWVEVLERRGGTAVTQVDAVDAAPDEA